MEYLLPMTKIDLKAVLWANIQARMVKLYGKENLTRLIKDSGVGPGTVTRIKEQQTSVGVEVLEKIAAALKVEPWQLLHPKLGLPDVVTPMSPAVTQPSGAPPLSNAADQLVYWIDQVKPHLLQAVLASAVNLITAGVRGRILTPIELPEDSPPAPSKSAQSHAAPATDKTLKQNQTDLPERSPR